MRDFHAWLRGHLHVAGADAAGEAAFLERLLAVARAQGDDFDEPDTVVDMHFAIAEAGDGADAEARAAVLEVLHDYLHFRIDTDDYPAPWIRADFEIGVDEIDEPAHPFDLIDADIPAALEEAAAAAGRVGVAARLAALGRMRLVTAVDLLLEWVGAGRTITETGSLRRTDIEAVAAMLGIAAVGAAKRSTRAEDEHGPIRVTSMWELPLLSAWWAAMRDAQLIELTATRVRPGPHAAPWREADAHGAAERGTAASLDLRENLVAMTFAHRLADAGWGSFDDVVAAEAVRRLLPAIAPRAAAGTLDVDAESSDYLHEQVVVPQTLRLLHDLESVDMLEIDELGAVTVQPALREAFARGLVLFARMADQLERDPLS